MSGAEAAATAPDAVGRQDATQRWDRSVDTAIVIILAVASLLAAWGGYQASLWSGEKTAYVTKAEEKQIEATRATTIGYQVMQIDIALFLNWLNAFKDDKTALADFYVERFSPRLQPAFADAERVGAIGDAYVLTTLLLAVVLFFAGVCTKIGWRPAQLALLVIAVVLLLYSTQKLGALTDGSEWAITPLWG